MNQCNEKDCNEKDNLVKCRLLMFRGDMPLLSYWKLYGLKEALRCWKELFFSPSHICETFDYYCPEHCQKNGYCWGCGEFWAGSESFDFSRSGLCSNCAGDPDLNDDIDEEEDGYYPYDRHIDFDGYYNLPDDI